MMLERFTVPTLAGLAALFAACSSDPGSSRVGSTIETPQDPTPAITDNTVVDTDPVPGVVETPPIETPPIETPPPNAFIVHEWGTFTSVQDSSGGSQPGLHHEDEELPAWVHRRDLGPNAYFEELPEEPLQQLETPVLYFYSEEPRDVQVEVRFPEGIISQWYPDATDFLPEPYTMTAVANGSMRWNVRLDPAITPEQFLPVDPKEIWAPSRRVASTPLAFDFGAAGGMPDGVSVEREQFIFYRGLGSFDLPVRTRAGSDGAVVIANESDDPLAAVVILNRTADGGGVQLLGALPARGAIEVAVPRADRSHADYEAEARATLEAAIVGTGLYQDEARAMVDTWTRSWFGNLGVRVLYLVPNAWTDRLLPIEITPKPDAIVRTLVGRIEVMTEASERETLERIQALGESPAWDEVERAIDELGRFAEPRIRRALATHGSSTAAEWLLDAAHQRP